MDLRDLDNRVKEQFDRAVFSLKQIDPRLAEQLHSCKYSIFYTNPKNSLREGNIYFLGLNPGGTPENKDLFQIRDSSAFLRKDHCAFLDEEWWHRNRKFPKGEALLQRRIRALLEFLLNELRDQPDIRKVFATNSCFFRSPDMDSLMKYKDYDCWKYHEEFLNIVKPKLVVCNGNGDRISAFSLFKKHFSVATISKKQWYRGFSLKWFFIDKPFWRSSKKALVLGIPHMSRYDPNNERVVQNGVNEMYKKIAELCSEVG